MQVIYIDDPQQWNDFVAGNSNPASFSQSWEYGEIQKKSGYKVFRLAVVADNSPELLTTAQVVVKHLLGTRYYAVIEHGPVFKDAIMWKPLLVEIKRIAQEHSVVFLRTTPNAPSESTYAVPKHAHRPTILRKLMAPQTTLLSDLSHSEETLLAGMHQKTRYNINLAVKKGVTARNSDINTFYTLMEETSKRQGIKIFPKSHYEQLLSNSGDMQVRVVTAYLEETPLATAMVADFGNTTTYLHGGSSTEHRKLMAPFLLHWENLRDAKHAGRSWYDWWGISTKNEKKWDGITRFKKGFGNETTTRELHYAPTKDLVYMRFWYTVFSIGKYLKR